jgi:hypothetical protein
MLCGSVVRRVARDRYATAREALGRAGLDSLAVVENLVIDGLFQLGSHGGLPKVTFRLVTRDAKFAPDSPLEGRGFELSVPLQKPTGVDHPGSAAAERREVQVGLIIR